MYCRFIGCQGQQQTRWFICFNVMHHSCDNLDSIFSVSDSLIVRVCRREDILGFVRVPGSKFCRGIFH